MKTIVARSLVRVPDEITDPLPSVLFCIGSFAAGLTPQNELILWHRDDPARRLTIRTTGDGEQIIITKPGVVITPHI